MKKNRFKNLALVVILFFIVPLAWQAVFLNLLPISNNMSNFSSIHTSAIVDYGTKQWLNDTGFNYPSGNWTSSSIKDPTDVDASIINNEAQLMVTGDIRTFSNITGTPDPSDTAWVPNNNTEVKYEPDSYEINSKGCWVTHTWSDGDDSAQLNAIQWDKNVTLNVDMSDYNITAVSLSVMANATVHADDGATEGIEIKGENEGGASYANNTGDFVRFYVYISDIYKNQEYEIAFLQPDDLGIDTAGNMDYLLNTSLTVISEENIRNLLKSVLEVDPEHKTFIFSLGILILCEDDYNNDEDIWDELVINDCNFSFTYEKIISQLCGVSWDQEANKISDLSDEYYVQVTSANLNFLYKINETWPTSLSPSSEIRCLINNNPSQETIKLSQALSTYQNASMSGFDITSLIIDEVDFSIQLFIRDEFALNRTIAISIDNVSLVINYRLLTIDTISPLVQALSWLIPILVIGLIAVGIYFAAYQTYLKYPRFVRLIRGLRKRVKKGRSLKAPILIRSREKILKHHIREKMKILRIEPGIENSRAATKSLQGAKQIDNYKKIQER